MPTIASGNKEFNTNEIFNFIFDGASGQATIPVQYTLFGKWKTANFTVTMNSVEMGSLKAFINQDDTQDPTKRDEGYVNTGILVAEIGTKEELDAITGTVIINETETRTDGIYMAKRSFVGKQDLRFSKSLVDVEKDLALTKVKTSLCPEYVFGTDGIFYIWSYQDGRGWKVLSPEVGANTTNLTLSVTRQTAVASSTASHTLSSSKKYTDTSKNPIIYRGYYDAFSDYADKYVVNDDNKLIKD